MLPSGSTMPNSYSKPRRALFLSRNIKGRTCLAGSNLTRWPLAFKVRPCGGRHHRLPLRPEQVDGWQKLGHPVLLEFDALDLTDFRFHDVDLKHVLGSIHSNDRQLCGTLHDGVSSSGGYDESPLRHIDAVAARLRHARSPARCRGGVHAIWLCLVKIEAG